MLLLAFRIALGSIAFALLATPTNAAPIFHPAADGIDRVCNAYVPSVAPSDRVTLARVPMYDGSVPIWRPSDPVENERIQSDPKFSGGDFATAIFDHGSLVFADTVHVDAQETGTQTRAWCFIGGKLSRASIETFDAVSDRGWRRWLYYGDDLEKPFSERVGPRSSRLISAPSERPPLDTLGIDAFGSPAKLPFYDALVVAHAHAKTTPKKAPAPKSTAAH